MLLGLIVALLIPLALSLRRGMVHLTRTLGFVILGLVTCAEAASASFLVLNLTTQPISTSDLPHPIALSLLRDAALIWIVNILFFPRLPILPRVLRSSDSNAAGPRSTQICVAHLSR